MVAGLTVVGICVLGVVAGASAARGGGRRRGATALAVPAVVVFGLVAVVPAAVTVVRAVVDGGSLGAGLRWVVTSAGGREALVNDVAVAAAVTVGSVLAAVVLLALAFVNRAERLVTTVVVVPAAMSLVAVGVAWRLLLAYRPAGVEQPGVVNAAMDVLGLAPVAWLTQDPVNLLGIVAALVWTHTALALLVLGAAVSRVPPALLDAARVDGASEPQVLRRVVLPSVRGALAAVTVTLAALSLQVFDVVQVMTGGAFGTRVLTTELVDQAFRRGEIGRAAGLATVLALLVAPLAVLRAGRVRRLGGRA